MQYNLDLRWTRFIFTHDWECIMSLGDFVLYETHYWTFDQERAKVYCAWKLCRTRVLYISSSFGLSQLCAWVSCYFMYVSLNPVCVSSCLHQSFRLNLIYSLESCLMLNYTHLTSILVRVMIYILESCKDLTKFHDWASVIHCVHFLKTWIPCETGHRKYMYVIFYLSHYERSFVPEISDFPTH